LLTKKLKLKLKLKLKSLSEKRLDRFREKKNQEELLLSKNLGTGSSPKSHREKLRNPKRPLAKCVQEKNQEIAGFAKNERFIGVLDAWNKIPGVRITRRFDKEGELTKTFILTVLSVKSFLAKHIYKTGVILSRQKRITSSLPDNFEELKIDYSYNSLVLYIQRFNVVLNDQDYLPEDKSFVRGKDLSTFLLGRTSDRSKAKSPLLVYCLEEPIPSFKQENPNWVYHSKEMYRLYIDRHKTFSAREQKDLYLLCKKLINHFDGQFRNKNYTAFLDWFFQSMRKWNPGTTRGLLSEGCWKIFLDHYKQSGR
jgi:hypothetical protein